MNGRRYYQISDKETWDEKKKTLEAVFKALEYLLLGIIFPLAIATFFSIVEIIKNNNNDNAFNYLINFALFLPLLELLILNTFLNFYLNSPKIPSNFKLEDIHKFLKSFLHYSIAFILFLFSTILSPAIEWPSIENLNIGIKTILIFIFLIMVISLIGSVFMSLWDYSKKIKKGNPKIEDFYSRHYLFIFASTIFLIIINYDKFYLVLFIFFVGMSIYLLRSYVLNFIESFVRFYSK